jgi:hypothetical protein
LPSERKDSAELVFQFVNVSPGEPVNDSPNIQSSKIRSRDREFLRFFQYVLTIVRVAREPVMALGRAG